MPFYSFCVPVINKMITGNFLALFLFYHIFHVVDFSVFILYTHKSKVR